MRWIRTALVRSRYIAIQPMSTQALENYSLEGRIMRSVGRRVRVDLASVPGPGGMRAVPKVSMGVRGVQRSRGDGHLTCWTGSDLEGIYLELYPAKVMVEPELDAVFDEARMFQSFLSETGLLGTRATCSASPISALLNFSRQAADAKGLLKAGR